MVHLKVNIVGSIIFMMSIIFSVQTVITNKGIENWNSRFQLQFIYGIFLVNFNNVFILQPPLKSAEKLTTTSLLDHGY